MNFVRLLLHSLTLAALTLSLQANISPLAFNGIFNHFKPGYELYAPNIGCAALKNGTIDAIRFYNVVPGPKDAQDRRLYIQDTALKGDPFAELAILLFPSPAGQLTAMTSHSQSIGAQLSVQDVATLLNFCAKVRATVSAFRISDSGEKIHFMGGNEFGNNFSKIMKRLQSAAQNQIDIDYFKNFLSNHRRFSLVLPRAKELLCLLCKCIELEERDDRRDLFASNPEHYKNFEKYTEASFYPKYTPEMLVNAFFCLKFGSEDIHNLINNLDEQIVDHQFMFEDGLLDENDLKRAAAISPEDSTLDDLWVIQNRDLMDNVIPYSRQCIPVNNGLASGYDRENNQLLEHETYPDCTETTIRHLCNLALYDKHTKSWNLQHVLEKIENIQTANNFENFYHIQKPEQANSGEMSVRNAWSKVVNNLDGNIRYNQKYLQASVKNDNEVDSGLVNIMRVLNTVFNLGLEQEPVFENNQQYAQAVQNWVQTGLETFFKTLAPEMKAHITISNIAVYIAADNREDCSGIINVTVGQDFKFVMIVKVDHAQFDSITNLALEKLRISEVVTSSYAHYHAHVLQHCTGEQILLLKQMLKRIWLIELQKKLFIKTPLHSLFATNVIDSAAIITMLLTLYDTIDEKSITDTRASLILRNALQRFLWQDGQMSKNIQSVIKDFLNLEKKEITVVLQQEVKTLVYDDHSEKFATTEQALEFFNSVTLFTIHNLTNLKISGCTCPKLKELDLSWTENLKSLKLSGDFNTLEKITLFNSGIKNLKISATCPNLKKIDFGFVNHLESLELSGDFNTLQEIAPFDSGIKNLKISAGTYPNLKTLNLIATYNLESLELSSNLNALELISLFDSRIKNLKISGGTYPNLKTLNLEYTKNLKSLELPGDFNALEEITLNKSGIKELILDKNSFPKLTTNDPRIKLIDKKRKRDEDDFEEEIGKENKHTKLDEAEQAVGPNNLKD